jgi:hypothetical protein
MRMIKWREADVRLGALPISAAVEKGNGYEFGAMGFLVWRRRSRNAAGCDILKEAPMKRARLNKKLPKGGAFLWAV